MKISIIVPVYNVEKYIDRCLYSLCKQNILLSDYEIIVINDGSTDGSEGIVLDYQNKYKNIVYIKQENKGLAEARNVGIDQAVGRYIMFVDSDDFIVLNCLKFLYDSISGNDADVLYAKHFCIDEKNNVSDIDKYRMEDVPVTIYSGREYLYNNSLSGIKSEVCDCIYRRDFLIEKKMYFPEGRYFEDIGYTIRAFYLADKIAIASYPFYVYYLRTNTISRCVYSIKHYEDKLFGYISLFDFFRTKGDIRILNQVNDYLFSSVKRWLYEIQNLDARQQRNLLLVLKESGIVDFILQKKRDIQQTLTFTILNRSSILYIYLVKIILFLNNKNVVNQRNC